MRVYGKLNLFLNVFELSGGFHEIESVFASCFDIYDEINISVCDEKDAGVFFSVADFVYAQSEEYVRGYKEKVGLLCEIEDNAQKALRLFCEDFHVPYLRAEIAKGIPFLAGMGGSSADAAGVLKILCEMFDKSFEDVAFIASQIGSDLVGMMHGGVSFCTGRGEKASKIADSIGGYAVVCVPDFGMSSKDVFGVFDTLKKVEIFPKAKDCLYSAFDYISEFATLKNSLMQAGFIACDNAKEFFEFLEEMSGVKFLMTGSGSGFFTLAKDEKTAREIAGKVGKICAFCGVTKV